LVFLRFALFETGGSDRKRGGEFFHAFELRWAGARMVKLLAEPFDGRNRALAKNYACQKTSDNITVLPVFI